MAIKDDEESTAVISPTDHNKSENESGKVLPAEKGIAQQPKINISAFINKIKVNLHRNKKLSIIIVIIILSLLSFAIWAVTRDKPKEVAIIYDACSSDTELLNNYTSSFNETNISEMVKIKDTILLKTDYTNDPNCLLITTQTFVFLEDLQEATKHYDLLNTKYNQEIGYVEPLNSVAKTPVAIKEDIDFLNSRVSDVEQRSYLGGSIRE